VQTRLSLRQAVKRKGRAKEAKTPRSPRMGPAAALRAGAAQHLAPAAATPQATGPSTAFVAAIDQCGVCNRALNRQLRMVQQQLAAVDAERAALCQGLAAADAERAALRQGLGEADAERAALRQGLGEAAAERAALRQGLGEAERKCCALREELARAHASKAVAALHLRQLHWYSDVRAWTRLLVVAQARAPLPPRAPPRPCTALIWRTCGWRSRSWLRRLHRARQCFSGALPFAAGVTHARCDAQGELRVGEQLGAGAYGSVTAAEHAEIGALAVKRVSAPAAPGRAAAPGECAAYCRDAARCKHALEFLATEARVAAALAHCPYIVTARAPAPAGQAAKLSSLAGPDRWRGLAGGLRVTPGAACAAAGAGATGGT